MKARGLILSQAKTKIVHLSEGFDFLGFNIRHYKRTTSSSGWKPLIKPSKQSVQKLRIKLRKIWQINLGKPVVALLEKLNPVIRGWANYFRTQVSKETFSKIDFWMFIRAHRWVKRTHPNKSDKWRESTYWGRMNLDRNDRWVFGDKQTGAYLNKFAWFPIERHILVKLKASPDDPTLKDYWESRNKTKVKDLVPSKQKVAKRQDYKCPICSDSLFNCEELHLHHKIPKKTRWIRYLHKFGTCTPLLPSANTCSIAELVMWLACDLLEPDVLKGTSPVLRGERDSNIPDLPDCRRSPLGCYCY